MYGAFEGITLVSYGLSRGKSEKHTYAADFLKLVCSTLSIGIPCIDKYIGTHYIEVVRWYYLCTQYVQASPGATSDSSRPYVMKPLISPSLHATFHCGIGFRVFSEVQSI